MNRIYRLVLLATASLCFAYVADAQSNLLNNGNFEGEWTGSDFERKPQGWNISRALTNYESGQRTGGSGEKIFMAYLDNGGSISQADTEDGWRAGVLPVERGATYKLTIWHKATHDNIKFNVVFNYYKKTTDDEEWQDEQTYNFVAQKDQWVKFEQDIKVPTNNEINVAGVSISFPYKSGAKIYLDDISLVKAGGDPPPPVQKPEAPTIASVRPFQREVVVSWNKRNEDGITYEVKVGEHTFTGITDNSFTIEKLTPGQTYEIEVCAVKDGVKSDYTKATERTRSYERAVDSEDRIPYLRTIEPDGSCKSRLLKLYYNDLANPNAKISYWLDGKPIQPVNNTLEFPAFEGFYKQFQLEIHINEGEGREWEILHNELSVRNS